MFLLYEKIYLDILSNELKSVQTYQRVNTSEMELFASHDSFNNKHGITLEDNLQFIACLKFTKDLINSDTLLIEGLVSL